MKEVFNSVRAQITERVSHPIFLPFAISWSILNHEVILYILSKNSVELKLSKIDAHFATLSFFSNGYTLGIIYPALLACLFVAIYPVANRYLMMYWRWQARFEKKNLVEHEDKLPLTREEARTIRRDAENAVNELEIEVEKKERRNQVLAGEIEKFEAVIHEKELAWNDS